MIAGLSYMSFGQAQQTNQAPMQQGANAHSMPPEQMAQREASMKKQAEAMTERQTKDMQAKFGLSDEQAKKVHDVNMDFNTKMISSRNAAEHPATPQMHKALFEERNEKMKTILTPEQYTKYLTTVPQMGQRPPNQPAPANQQAPATK